MYYAFGDTDMYAICDMPDNASATAVSLLVNASGAVSLNLTPFMTPEDVDAAAAKTPSYRAPGPDNSQGRRIGNALEPAKVQLYPVRRC